MKDRKLYFESFLATLLVLLMVWLLFFLFSMSLKPLNFVANSIKEIYLSDIYFSHIKEQKADTSIVLVNIGELNRTDIATLINLIGESEPAAIGLDVLFSKTSPDKVGLDSVKRVAAKFNDLIVFPVFYDQQTNNPDVRYHVLPNVKKGHINLISNQNRTQPVRYFHPYYLNDQGEYFYSFAAKISSIVDIEKFEPIKSKSSKRQIINYFGDGSAFRTLEATDILNGSIDYSSFINDKVVLMGFLGSGKFSRLDDLSDKYYSPLNETFFGRSHPDIYGLVIHANMVKMILEGDYINQLSPWKLGILTFAIVYIHMIAFMFFFVKRHVWYHIAAKLIQLVSLILIVGLLFISLDRLNILPDFIFLFLAIFLSVDLLYLYEALSEFAYKRFGWKSYFIKDH